MAALSPRVAAAPPSGVSKSRKARRSSDPLPNKNDVTTKTKSLNGRRRTNSSRHIEESGGGIDAAFDDSYSTKKNMLEIQRGVRPRLNDIRCPVTKKTLMEDFDASLASTSISSSTTDDHGDDSEDEYSESDIGLNHSHSISLEEKASLRNDKRKNNRSSNVHGKSSYLKGRKGDGRTERNLDGDSRRAATSSNNNNNTQQSRRRMPKHYNNLPGAAAAAAATQTKPKKHDSSATTKSRRDKKHTTTEGNLSKRTASPLSKLSTEVAQFQKMVADLESLAKSSVSSPEAMWKSRILRRSANDADKDLALALEHDRKLAETEHDSRSVAASAKAASRKKLQRDYHRASEQFRSVLENMERRQKAEVSCLNANEAATKGEKGTAKVASKRMLLGAEEAEEDFFDRAMRERQEEVQNISDGMKKVQEIYTDLAGLVDGQQDQIDQLEDLNEEVKADTKAGLEEIQHGMWKLCVADQQQPTNGNPYNSFDGTANNKKNRTKTVLDPSDIFNCVMACQGPSEFKPAGGKGARLSLDDVEDLYHERNAATDHDNAKYYRDDVTSSSGKAWSLLNLEDVQESAQDAYERGQAMVGGLVVQVQEVVATGGDGLPLQLRNMSCTPQNEDLFFAGDDDDSNEDVTTNDETTSGTLTVREGMYGDDDDDSSEVGYHHNHRENKSQRSRSRSHSRQRSLSRSTPKHDKKHRSRHKKDHHHHEEREEERYGHEEALLRNERRHRGKGSKQQRKRTN